MKELTGYRGNERGVSGGKGEERLVVLGIAARDQECHVALVDVTRALTTSTLRPCTPYIRSMDHDLLLQRSRNSQQTGSGHDQECRATNSPPRRAAGDRCSTPPASPSCPRLHEANRGLLAWDGGSGSFWLDDNLHLQAASSDGASHSDAVSISLVSSPSPLLESTLNECSMESGQHQAKRSCPCRCSCSPALTVGEIDVLLPSIPATDGNEMKLATQAGFATEDSELEEHAVASRAGSPLLHPDMTWDRHSEATESEWLVPVAATEPITPGRDDNDLGGNGLDLFMEEFLGEPLMLVTAPQPDTGSSSSSSSAPLSPTLSNAEAARPFQATRSQQHWDHSLSPVTEKSLASVEASTGLANRALGCRFLAQFSETVVSFDVRRLGAGHQACELLVQHVEILLLEAYALANVYESRCRRALAEATKATRIGAAAGEPFGQVSGSMSSKVPRHNDAFMRSYQRRLSNMIGCCMVAGERERERLKHASDGELDSDLDEADDLADLESVLRQVALCCGRKPRRRQTGAFQFRLVGLSIMLDNLSAAADQRALAERLEWRFHCPTTVVCWDDITLPLIRVIRPSPLATQLGSSDNLEPRTPPSALPDPWRRAALLLFSSERGCLCRLVADAPAQQEQSRSPSSGASGCLDIRVGGYGPLLGDEGSPFVLALDALRGMLRTLDGMGGCCSDEHWEPTTYRSAAETLLVQALKHFECVDLESLLRCIYHIPLPRSRMVEFGYLVAALADPNPHEPQGNGIAAMAVYRAGHALGRHLAAAFWQSLPAVQKSDVGVASVATNTTANMTDARSTHLVPVVCVGHLFSFLGHSGALAEGLRAGWRRNRTTALPRIRLQLCVYPSSSKTKTTDPAEVMAVLLACDRSGVPGHATEAFLEYAAPHAHLEPVLVLE